MGGWSEPTSAGRNLFEQAARCPAGLPAQGADWGEGADGEPRAKETDGGGEEQGSGGEDRGAAQEGGGGVQQAAAVGQTCDHQHCRGGSSTTNNYKRACKGGLHTLCGCRRWCSWSRRARRLEPTSDDRRGWEP